MMSGSVQRRVLVGLSLAAWLSIAAPRPVVGQPAPPRAELERKDPGGLMGERAFRRFENLTALYSNGQYREALAAVEAYLKLELSDYERAMGEQLRGFILIGLDRGAEAIPGFEDALKRDALPNSAHFKLMKSLAQLHASLGQWPKAIEMLSRYLRYQPEPAADDMILMGQCYVQLDRYRDALPWVQGAIQAAGAAAQESWHQLELAIHFDLKDYRAALGVLNSLVARWPDRLRYWEMMAGAHQELNQDTEALSALLAAYNGELIRDEAKILNLVRLSLYVELPFQAGEILSEAMDGGQVRASKEHLELLLSAWTAAREFDRAGQVIDRLAPQTGDGNLYMQKAQLLMQQNRWQATIDAGRQALELGKLSRPGEAWLLIGIASMELGKLQESRQALLRAQEFDEATRRQAREWQRFVEDRIQVAEARR